MSNLSSSDEEYDDYSDIKDYFRDVKLWSSLSRLDKEAFRNIRNRYLAFKENGMTIQIPPFMKWKEAPDDERLAESGKDDQESASAARRDKRSSKACKRKSTGTSASAPRKSGRQQEKRLKENNANTNPQDQPLEMEESFPEIKLYYSPTKWSSMSIIVKRHLQTSKDEYDAAVKAGLDSPLPKFMLHTRPSTSINQVPSSSDSGGEMHLHPYKDQNKWT